jgi:glycosyltransferase involved in cell wall biosynthesis
MKKVSIIVPIYNNKSTLIPCMSNLINQTLDDIEIILINDASTDNSMQIINLFSERFPDKVVPIDSPFNQGAGGARNLGIAKASGEYIGFVDADDIIEPTMYEKLYNEAIRTGYDIIDSGFYHELHKQAIIYTSDELTGTLNSKKRNDLIASGGYIVTKLFKSSLIKENDFVFRNNCILEDSEILSYAFAIANSIGNIKEILYYYKNYSNSSSKIIDAKEYFYSCFNAMKAIYDKLSVLENYQEIKEGAEYEMLQMYSYAINNLFLNESADNNFEILSALNEIQAFRNINITAGYDNQYIKSKLSKTDIQIMKLCDESPEKLIRSVTKQ